VTQSKFSGRYAWNPKVEEGQLRTRIAGLCYDPHLEAFLQKKRPLKPL